MTRALLTDEEFEAARPRLTRMDDAAFEIARRVLVLGANQAEIAREKGVSRQAIRKVVLRVEAALANVPADWERVEAWLPPLMAAEVRKMEAQAQANRNFGGLTPKALMAELPPPPAPRSRKAPKHDD